MEHRFEEQKEWALAKEYAQIYRIVLDLFDKFAELLGEEEIALTAYCELLDAGLERGEGGSDSARNGSGHDRGRPENTIKKQSESTVFCGSK